MFLLAALAGQAGLLVTNNKKHFPGDVSTVKIVNVREFLQMIERQRGRRTWGTNAPLPWPSRKSGNSPTLDERYIKSYHY
jgi:hypothetical protein